MGGFFLITGLLTYLGETQRWNWFLLALLVSACAFGIERALDSKAAAAFFRELELREFRVVHQFEDYGVKGFYNMQNPEEQDRRNSDTRAAIGNASAMYLAANSAASYVDPGLERHWPYVKRRLDDGCIFHLLVLDPFSYEKRVRDKLNLAGEAPDSKFRFDVLIRLYSEYQNVHIRVVTSHMYCTVFFTQDQMFYDPYHIGQMGGRISNRFFCFRLASHNPPVPGYSYFDVLKKHFETLWQMSSDFEDYVIDNKELIERLNVSTSGLRFRHRRS